MKKIIFLIFVTVFCSSANCAEISFRETPFTRVATLLRDAYGVDFITDPAIKNLPTITLSFEAENGFDYAIKLIRDELIKQSIVVSYFKEKRLVIVTQFSDSSGLQDMLRNRAKDVIP